MTFKTNKPFDFFRKIITGLGLMFFSALLMGCQEEIEIPTPHKLTRAAVGNYCHMILVDHPGPKVQIFEKDMNKPLWFSSVRDGLAYMALPGEAQNVLIAYVHDMGQATSWERPQNDHIWIKADEAHYVIDSSRRGGMGAKETVPFKDRNKALAFTEKYGGKVVLYKDIPPNYILGDEDEYNNRGYANKGMPEAQTPGTKVQPQ